MIYLLAAILLAIAIFLAGFAGVSFNRCKATVAALPLSLLLVALALYSGGYAGELLSKSLRAKLLWNAFQYLGISFLPTLWIAFTARYVNVPLLYRKPLLAGMIALSLLTLFGVATDGIFHLRYASVGIVSKGGLSLLAFTRGPIYWSHTVFSFAGFLTGSVLLVNGIITTPRYFRHQLLLMLAGTMLPWVNYGFYLAGINFGGIDTIPFSTFVSAVCFGTAIFKYRVLDVIPVARSRVFETMSDGVIVLDSSGRLADYNPSAGNVIPELTKNAISSDARALFAGYESLLMNVEMNVEADFPFSVGSGDLERHYLAKISIIRNGNGAAIGRIVSFKDNTETIKLLHRLKELATLDPLTGINNRRMFMDSAKRAIAHLSREGKPMAVAILDLDDFKRLNDTYGHLAGDEILRRVAKEITNQVRSGDIVARFGGEEFICLMSEADPHAAPAIAERMRAAIERISIPVEGGLSAGITASFGLYCVTAVSGDESLDALLSRADTALYEAKAEGKNRVRVYLEGQ